MIAKLKQKRIEQQKISQSQNTNNLKTAEQRMKTDIMKYEQNRIDNVIITYPNEGSITQLIISVIPNKDRSHYRNSKIQFSFQVSQKYPYEPPKVKCLNKILHPNIDLDGNVCLSILKGGWKPIYELYQVVMGLLHLLQNIKAGDIEDPLDKTAAELMNKDLNEFDKIVQQTIKGKSMYGRKFDNVFYEPKKK